MGLSKGQKKRLYGENTQASSFERTAPSVVRPSAPGPRVVTDFTRAELAAEPGKGGGSRIFLGVAFVVTVLFMLYYYLLLLPGVSVVAGATAPELMVGFSAQHLQEVAAGLGVDGLREYQILHRSTGLIVPLIFAFTWWNLIRASEFELLVGRVMLVLPVAFALVFIAGGFALDLALANPLSTSTPLASFLMSARWALLVLCLVQLGYLVVRLVRSKVDAYARGDLPGQV
ncbi:hypothetical protein [Rothia nasimurium]|uniref:hypothetical protein n=1 Tax=Rothia nasimurium TaxID=85336 RepID=UPI003B9DF739